MFGQRMLDVHEQDRASGGLLRSGFFKLVERRQGHFMLSRESIAPVARKCRGRLHDSLADKLGCKSGCDARACRKSKIAACGMCSFNGHNHGSILRILCIWTGNTWREDRKSVVWGKKRSGS